MKMYSINDAKAAYFNQPFFARTNADALRTFQQLVNSDPKQSQIAAYPGDFTLFEVGEFDETNGIITAAAPKSLGNGLEYKNQE